jgi:hypothetical protein
MSKNKTKQNFSRPHLNGKKLDMGACVVIPAIGSINRRTVVQPGLVKKQDPVSKMTRTKRAGDMAQVAEHLPGKCEAVSSNPSL